MKKILSLFISFLFFFGLFSNVFAVKTNSVNIDDFNSFSIEQVQKVFSNSLSQEQSSENKTESQSKDIFTFSDTDYNIPTFFIINLRHPINNIFFYDVSSYAFNCFYRNKLFNEAKLFFNGISEYKIAQNSYMAVALFDVVNFIYDNLKG